MITYRPLEQMDDLGYIYDAFTLEAYDDADDVTTWYKNIVTGWAWGTPKVHYMRLFTPGDVPEDLEAWGLEDLDDAGRLELAERARVVLNRPAVDLEQVRAAGLRYLGDVEIRHSGAPGVDPSDEFYTAIMNFLDSIGYDDVTSF